MTDIDLRPLVAGRHVDSASPAQMPSIDPSTEEVLWHLPCGDPVDVDAAVRAARDAFASSDWAHDAALR